MELHVFPIPIPPPTSLSTWSLWVFPVHQARALVSCIQPGLVICITIDNIHVSMLFFQNIPPSPSPTVVLKVWPHFGTCSITWESFEMQILQLHPRPTNALGTKVQQSAWANPPGGSAAHWHLRILINRHQKKKLPQIQMMCDCSIVPPSWWAPGLIPTVSYNNKKSVSDILSNTHLHGLMLVFL